MTSTAFAPGPRTFPADTMIRDLIDPAGPQLRRAAHAHLARVTGFLRGDHPIAQLVRFALVGGASNIAYVLLFMAMTATGPLLANIAGSLVSTVIANELHRRLTFNATARVTWFTAQWEAGGLALIGLALSTAALAALSFLAPTLGPLAQAAAVIAIMAAIGAARFLALRGFVF